MAKHRQAIAAKQALQVKAYKAAKNKDNKPNALRRITNLFDKAVEDIFDDILNKTEFEGIKVTKTDLHACLDTALKEFDNR